MGEGVSLSLPRKGVLGADLLLSAVSVPFTREHVCSGGSNLLDFGVKVDGFGSRPLGSDRQ